MIKKTWIGIVCITLFAVGCSKSGDTSSTTGTTDTGKPAAQGTDAAGYAAVQAIFTKNCAGCHGATSPKGGINLTSYETAMKGGQDGPVITAGDPDKSKLVDALRARNGAMQMPKGSAPLPDADIKTIEDWIKAGAKQ